jgi:hypothetical protein
LLRGECSDEGVVTLLIQFTNHEQPGHSLGLHGWLGPGTTIAHPTHAFEW